MPGKSAKRDAENEKKCQVDQQVFDGIQTQTLGNRIVKRPKRKVADADGKADKKPKTNALDGDAPQQTGNRCGDQNGQHEKLGLTRVNEFGHGLNAPRAACHRNASGADKLADAVGFHEFLEGVNLVVAAGQFDDDGLFGHVNDAPAKDFDDF